MFENNDFLYTVAMYIYIVTGIRPTNQFLSTVEYI